MTGSEIRLKTMELDEGMRIAKRKLSAAKQAISDIKTQLEGYPTQFGEYISAVDGLESSGFGDDAKEVKASQVAEFQALKTAAQTAETSLESITEF